MPLNRILFVDHAPDDVEGTSTALSRIGGMNVDVCANGAEAVVVGMAQPPDLILIGAHDRDDGTEALRIVRDCPALAATPVIVLCDSESVAKRRFRGLGAAGFIETPVDPLTLPAKLRAFWAASWRS